MIQYKREALGMTTKLEQKYKAEWKKMSQGEKESYFYNFDNFFNKWRQEHDSKIQQKQD